jgi:flagellar motility protein MotE (MotC chaperone)
MINKGKLLRPVLIIGAAMALMVPAALGFGQEDPHKALEQKRQELNDKEARLKKEEERLKAVQKEVEARIEKLNQMLSQIEDGLKKLGEVRSEKMGHLVKTFESMPPEEAGLRLTTLEKSLAVQIVFKMNSKKAGAVLATMEPRKVAELTEGVSKIEKKLPVK